MNSFNYLCEKLKNIGRKYFYNIEILTTNNSQGNNLLQHKRNCKQQLKLKYIFRITSYLFIPRPCI